MIESTEEILDQYFSVYLDYSVSKVECGQIILVSSKRRLRREIGWSHAVAVWVHIKGERAIISVRPDLFKSFKKMLREGLTLSQIYTLKWRKLIGSLTPSKETGALVYVLYCKPENLRLFHTPECRKLQGSDAVHYVRMKLDLYPGCDPKLLTKNIRRNIRDGIAFGVFQEGKLVSVSEAPPIGHMQDMIEEVGVDTLLKYRRRGYGKAVISATTKAIFDIGRIPIYRCSSKNVASIRLAKTVGYEKYADIIQFW